MIMFQDLLRKFNAELSEVLSRRSQVVTDDGDVLLNVKNDRGDVGALVTNMFHILPLHLKREIGQDKPLDPSQEDSLTCYQKRVRGKWKLGHSLPSQRPFCFEEFVLPSW